MKAALITILVGLAGPCAAASQEDAYAAGTDSGMRYLVQFGPALRETLLLDECGLNDLSRRAGASLPNSVAWFKASAEATALPAENIEEAAQVARAYLLGVETGIRLEFERASDDWRLASCNAAAAALQ